MPLLNAEPKERANSMLSNQTRPVTSGFEVMSGEIWGGKEAIQQRARPKLGLLGPASWLLISFPGRNRTRLLHCCHVGTAVAAAGDGHGNWARQSWKCGGGGRWTFVHPLFSVPFFTPPLPMVDRDTGKVVLSLQRANIPMTRFSWILLKHLKVAQMLITGVNS